jgi:diaminobutyrate-2-oxoglutarate transaminase
MVVTEEHYSERQDDVILRTPHVDDGAQIWELVDRMDLDSNSPYAYLLVSRHLAPTSVVAEHQGKVVGFVSGYRPPRNPDVLFVWQVGVDSSMRGRSIAKKMILHILDRDTCEGVRWIESTVTPQNKPSQRLFRSIARTLDTEIAVSPYFTRDVFPDAEEHKEEELYRIGPIDRVQDRDEQRGIRSSTFKRHESVVRSYCRLFPAVFERGEGHLLIDENGREHIDFLAAAGAMSYGHNNEKLRDALVSYIQAGGVVNSLDLYSTAKRQFLERFSQVILEPRDLDYRVMFPGPTGSDAVEAAVKLARKVSGRRLVVSFTGAAHGVTVGALALSGDRAQRAGAGVSFESARAMPYSGYHGGAVDTLALFESYLNDPDSGIDLPAAVIVETVQADGGVNVASDQWMQKLEQLCRTHGMYLIVDDVHVGCGRTGPFFSFEHSGIRPDMVVLSKALSGFGTPFSVLLIDSEIDAFTPGEHGSSFRGHNLAMVTATAALDYWTDDALAKEIEEKGAFIRERLERLVANRPWLGAEVRGRGLILGLDLGLGGAAPQVAKACFERGLLVDVCGPNDRVLKISPPLTIDRDAIDSGVRIIEEAVAQAAGA